MSVNTLAVHAAWERSPCSRAGIQGERDAAWQAFGQGYMAALADLAALADAPGIGPQYLVDDDDGEPCPGCGATSERHGPQGECV